MVRLESRTNTARQVLIINTPGLKNRGGMAVVLGALACLREFLPDARIVVLCHHTREDWDELTEICNRFDVVLEKHPWFKEHRSRSMSLLHSAPPAFGFLLQCVGSRVLGKWGKTVGMHQRSSIVLDLNADSLNDHYGVFFPLWTLANILLAKVSGSPVVVWGAGVGAFHRPVTRQLAKCILNRVDAILAREQVTALELERLRICRPYIRVTADHAFNMNPAPPSRVTQILEAEGISRSRPLIGMAVSQMMSRFAFDRVGSGPEKYQHYLKAMARAADYAVQTLNADIILTPHVLSERSDDRIASAGVQKLVENKSRVRVLAGTYTADELKGVIGECDLFIGCRMHATIASSSMGVPTIAVAYGQKFHAIIGDMMGLSDYIIGITHASPEGFESQLKTKMAATWASRHAAREGLLITAQAARERAKMNGELVRQFLQSGNWTIDPARRHSACQRASTYVRSQST